LEHGCEFGMLPREKADAILRKIYDAKFTKIIQNILQKPTEFRSIRYRDDDGYKDKYADIEWQPVARDVNRLLGDRAYMAKWSRAFLDEVLEETLRSGDRSSFLLEFLDLDVAIRVLTQRTQSFGWKDVLWFQSDNNNEFFDLLSAGYLFRDHFYSHVRYFVSSHLHGADSHLMQILAVAPEIDRIYGPGTMFNFVKYIGSSRKGRELWERLFDFGPDYYFEFRCPSGFYDFGVLTVFLGATEVGPRAGEPIYEPERRRSRR
jgi:hypothetical protein